MESFPKLEVPLKALWGFYLDGYVLSLLKRRGGPLKGAIQGYFLCLGYLGSVLGS